MNKYAKQHGENFYKLVNKPSYVKHETVNDDQHIVQKLNDYSLLNKLLYSSIAILEANYGPMFDFHYHLTIKKFKTKMFVFILNHY